MQAVDRARRWLASKLLPELRSLPPNGNDWWYNPVSWSAKTYSGKRVNETTALALPAVFSAHLVLSESMGQLPFGIFRKTEDGSEPDRGHPLWSLLHDAPNDQITAIDMRGQMQGSLCGWGNTYAEIIRDGGRGRPRELWPWDASFVEIERSKVDKRAYRYKYTDPHTGVDRFIAPVDVLHVRGWGPPDSLEGYSPIKAALREAVGNGLAIQEFAGRFFGQGTNLGGVIQHPGPLGKEGQDNLRTSLEKFYGGLKNSHGNLILEEGATYTRLGMPLSDAMAVEAYALTLQDVARIYRIPLHMLQDLTRSTNNNIEHQGLEFVVHTLMPWIVRWEQAIKQKLLLPSERDRFDVKFNVNAFMRGDVESRGKFYAAGRTGGWLSPNDIRQLEDMNKRPDGDNYDMPLNSNAAPSGDKKNDDTGTPVSTN